MQLGGAYLAVPKLWWPGLLLCALYLVVIGTLPLEVSPISRHDDDLFVSLASHIAAGEWLGPYGPLTLAKGPLLPVLIGYAMAMGWPVVLALRGLWALCCWLACSLALPIKPAWLRWLGLSLLLFDPWLLTLPGSRFVRELLFSPLLLLALALALAALEEQRRIYLWAGGLSFGLLLICREGRAGVLAIAGTLIALWLARYWSQPQRWLAAALAVMLLMAPVLAVQQLNARAYGAPISNEFEEGAFKTFYGELVSVNLRGLPAKPYVPLRREVISSLISLKPNSELVQVLSQLDPNWMQFGCRQQASMCGEYGGGWFVWALREAMAKVEPSADARGFQAQNQRLIRELKTLCRKPRAGLDCQKRSFGFLPWLPGRGEPLPWSAAAFDLARKGSGLLMPILVEQGPLQLDPLTKAELNHWPPAWQELGLYPRSAEESYSTNQRLATAYQLGSWGRLATFAALIALAVPKRWPLPLGPDGLLLLTLAVQLLLLTAVELTSFRADRYLVSLSPCLTLLILRLLGKLVSNPPAQPLHGPAT
jgi:hypothetical protein